MKKILVSMLLTMVVCASCAGKCAARSFLASKVASHNADSVTLQVNGKNAYYQKTVKVDSDIKVSTMYIRALQFMAAKNFQQTYGYEQEGKLIFTTTQDLNVNPVTTGSDLEDVQEYNVQFAITIDMRNGRYRYTVTNVTFYRPTDNGNMRLTLYDMVQKVSGDSRSVAKDARKLISSFERYLDALTAELYEGIEYKAAIYQPKF
jgi:hypothetical protein